MIGNPLLLGGGDYEISRSVRLRSSANAYFNRTPASAGNQQKWTWSGWVKRGALGANQVLMSAGTNGSSTNLAFLQFNSSDSFQFYVDTGAANYSLVTTQVFRDPSAWYHLVIAFDSTQATASNRTLIYVNGSQITAFSTANYTPQNNTYGINSTLAHNIGRYVFDNTRHFDGYITEINFIDGQALTPSSFGESNSTTGVWQPKKYTGTYGTNGFYLNFSDNSNNTAATIGKDYSGNGNNWTPNNISVTSGTTYDSMLDVPTLYADGGNGRGNYCTLNPLVQRWAVASATFSEANLKITTTGASTSFGFGTQEVSSGKWYWEVLVSAIGTATPAIGVTTSRAQNTVQTDTVVYLSNGQKEVGGSASSYGATYTTNDVIGIALDCDGGTVTFYKNNASQGSISLVTSSGMLPHFQVISNSVFAATFGQRPFAYTPPSGFKALNTLNLPEPTIKKGNQYFDVVLYTGDAVQDRAVTGFGFDLDLAWIKSRNNAGSHVLVNRVVGGDKQLFSNLTNAEQTNADVTNGFTTGGILLGDNVSGTGSTNQNTYTYALWGWKEGATQGFDIVTYTGTGSATTVAHNLGVAPSMMIVKRRDSATNGDWFTYHASLGNANAVYLNLTNASAGSGGAWNNTSPTSSVFTVGTSTGVNANGSTYVAYLFAEVAGFSKFGSYTGNGSSDGPFVFCGFRPRFIMVKRTDASASWTMMDSARNTANATTAILYPNLSDAEATSGTGWLLLSNGFKSISTGTDWNASGGTYIFAAFAENPFKNALAR